MRIRRIAVATAVIGLVAAGAVAVQGSTASAHGSRTKAVLRLPDGRAVGVVNFGHERYLTTVQVKLRLPQGVTALNDFHGFHIHANGDPANGSGCVADPAAAPATWFVSADGHFSQQGQVHGAHAGDLPSPLVAADGRSYNVFSTGRLRPRDVIGKALILHAGRDNFDNVPLGPGPAQYTANSPQAETLTDNTGNAGDRIACGLITRD